MADFELDTSEAAAGRRQYRDMITGSLQGLLTDAITGAVMSDPKIGPAAQAIGQGITGAQQQAQALNLDPLDAGMSALGGFGLSMIPGAQERVQGLGQQIFQGVQAKGPSQAPAGPTAVDPSTLQFMGGGQHQPGLGLTQAAGQTSQGMRLKMPTFPGGEGIREAYQTELAEPIQQLQGAQAEAGTKIKKALEARKLAEDEIVSAQQVGVEAQRKGMTDLIQKREALHHSYRPVIEKARADVAETMGRYQDEKVKLAEMNVDPGRRYAGGSKIGAAIAMALGAYGAALSRSGQNPAMQIIQSEINRDIAAQRDAIAKQKGVIGDAQNELGMARQLFADAESQELAAVNFMLENVKLTANAKALENQGPMMEAGLAKTNAAIDQQIGENEFKIAEKQTAQRIQTGTQAVGAEKAATQMDTKKAGMDAKIMAARIKQMTAKPMQAPPGMGILDKSKPVSGDDLKIGKKAASDYFRARGALDKLIAWRAKYGSEKIPGPAKTTGEALAKSVIRELKNLEKMGANFTEMEKELLGIPESPGEYGWVMSTLQTMKDTMTQKTMDGLVPYNLTIAAQQRKKQMKKSQVGG